MRTVPEPKTVSHPEEMADGGANVHRVKRRRRRQRNRSRVQQQHGEDAHAAGTDDAATQQRTGQAVHQHQHQKQQQQRMGPLPDAPRAVSPCASGAGSRGSSRCPLLGLPQQLLEDLHCCLPLPARQALRCTCTTLASVHASLSASTRIGGSPRYDDSQPASGPTICTVPANPPLAAPFVQAAVCSEPEPPYDPCAEYHPFQPMPAAALKALLPLASAAATNLVRLQLLSGTCPRQVHQLRSVLKIEDASSLSALAACPALRELQLELLPSYGPWEDSAAQALAPLTRLTGLRLGVRSIEADRWRSWSGGMFRHRQSSVFRNLTFPQFRRLERQRLPWPNFVAPNLLYTSAHSLVGLEDLQLDLFTSGAREAVFPALLLGAATRLKRLVIVTDSASLDCLLFDHLADHLTQLTELRLGRLRFLYEDDAREAWRSICALPSLQLLQVHLDESSGEHMPDCSDKQVPWHTLILKDPMGDGMSGVDLVDALAKLPLRGLHTLRMHGHQLSVQIEDGGCHERAAAAAQLLASSPAFMAQGRALWLWCQRYQHEQLTQLMRDLAPCAAAFTEVTLYAADLKQKRMWKAVRHAGFVNVRTLRIHNQCTADVKVWRRALGSLPGLEHVVLHPQVGVNHVAASEQLRARAKELGRAVVVELADF